MKYHLFILLIVFLLSFPSYSQWYPTGGPYHTQYTYQNRSDSTQEWQNASKTQFGYDQSNRRNLVNRYNWYNNRWRLQNEQRRTFDSNDNIIYESDKYWNDEPYRLSSENISIREFDGKKIIRNENIYIDYLGRRYESTTDYKYDSNGNFIEILRRSRENDQPYNESKYNTYYDNNQCSISWVSRWGLEGENWNSIDSTYLMVDSNCQTNLEQRFSVDPNTNTPELYAEYRYAREYDGNGNVTYLKFEERIQGADWILISEDFYTYDPSYGLIFEAHKFKQDPGFFEYRSFYNYTTDSLNYLQTTDIKEPTDSTWKSAGYYGYRVNDLGSLEYSTSENIWYDGEDEYYSSNQIFNYYDSENLLIRSTYSDRSSNPYEEEDNFYKSEEVFYYRCNGDEIESISTALDSSYDTNIGRQDRRTTEYLIQPLCAEANETTSIQLFPNPATEYIHVSYPETIGKTRISIVDQSGKLVLEQERFVSSYFTIDLGTMIAGPYILKIESETVNDSQRFVVVK